MFDHLVEERNLKCICMDDLTAVLYNVSVVSVFRFDGDTQYVGICVLV